jgi:DNA-binding HxlR family transcriptional regulator
MYACVLYCISLREVQRFNELQRQIPDISKKMLIQTLRNLERELRPKVGDGMKG